MNTDAKKQEPIRTEIHLMQEELREALRQLNAIEPRPEKNDDAWELGVANQAELESLRQEVVGLRRELQALKERAERFELEARRSGPR